jgi:hypothetical protein
LGVYTLRFASLRANSPDAIKNMATPNGNQGAAGEGEPPPVLGSTVVPLVIPDTAVGAVVVLDTPLTVPAGDVFMT